jgi:hypothetical protein
MGKIGCKGFSYNIENSTAMEIAMKRILEVTDQKELSNISDLLHDCIFEKGQIDYNEKNMVLSIALKCDKNISFINKLKLFSRKEPAPSISYLLQINCVNQFKIIDNSKDGPGDTELFNEILIDSNNNLIIRTFFAKNVEIAISDINITIDEMEVY